MIRKERLPASVLTLAFAIAVAICWILPARNPLSVDEAGTYWIVKDHLSDVVTRSYYWTNWSPYYLVEWMAVHAFGKNPIVMRLPSALATAIAALVLARIGERLWDRDAGTLAALVFVVMPDVAFAAGDARPYAFTLAALCGYLWFVLRWVDSGHIRHAIGAGAFAALTAYGHILIGLGLVIPAFYAVWSRPTSWHWIVALAFAGALCIPLAIQMRAYMAMNTTHFAGFMPVLADLWSAIASPQFGAGVAAGVTVAYVISPTLRFDWGISRGATLFLLASVAFVPSLLFALARTETAQLYIDRYLVSTAPSQALLFGALIRAASPRQARAIVAATVVLLSVTAFSMSAKSFHGHGWRDALAAARGEIGSTHMPLVMSSPYIEARTAENMEDPRLREVLTAPVSYYPVDTKVIPLTYDDNEQYLDLIASRDLKQERGFVLVTTSESTAQQLTTLLANRHPQRKVIGVYRGLRVYRFDLTGT